MYRPRRALSFTLVICFLFIPLALHAETLDVAMRDGTLLKTDVYLPEGGTPPYPVILIRSPYPRQAGAGEAKKYVPQGYAVVIQSVRGTDGSQGTFTGFLDEGWGTNRDGADTVKWLLEQSWCNGKIGGTGYSAPGNTQSLLSASTRLLTCQSIEAAATDFYFDLAYPGGVWRREQNDAWLGLFGEDGKKARELLRSHPTYDRFWQNLDVARRARRINTPGLFVGSWYDIFRDGTLRGYTARQYDGAGEARGKQLLIMKPNAHGDFPKDMAFTFPSNVQDLKISRERMNLFDFYLKGERSALGGTPRVWYYVIGDDKDPEAPGMEWRSATRWPPFPPREKAYYLAGQNLVTETLDKNEVVREFRYDPADPCPTVGGANLTIPAGPFDQRSVSGRADVLTFTGPVLSEPLEITGAARIRLFVSTDAPDTDFVAKLIDVYPAGDDREVLIMDSIRRLKFRKSFSKPAKPMTPGKVVEVTFELGTTSWIFNKGHRIGLQITSSNYPRFEKNPNTGDDFPIEGKLRVANNRIHMSREFDSALLLPVRDLESDIDHDGVTDEEEWARGTYRVPKGPRHSIGGCNCSGM
ncbi:MAG: CocE/NonD family hydrolase [Candidatus Hydrogenedentes bacterium]|nr:CocE/NonD family hydrolase [Candidatus Hydrogenedentota bacterium]